MPVIASPSTCTDTANIWTPWIKEITGVGYDATKYKLSIDIAAKKIRVQGHSTTPATTLSNYASFEAHFTLPNGMDTYFPFTIFPSVCTSITAPTTFTTSYTYMLGMA
jgi:hypothetical protein